VGCAVSAVERAVQEAAREARRAAQKIVSGTSEQEKLWRDGFVRGAGWRAERMPGGGHVIAKPVALHLARAALAAAAPTVEQVAEALPIPGGPKMLRETLCTAQAAIYRATGTGDRDDEHVARLQVLIDALDVLRPLGPDGKHGDRHTPWCGCDEQVVALWGTP